MIMRKRAGEGRSDSDATRRSSRSGQPAASRIDTTAIADFLQTAPLLFDRKPEILERRLVDDGRGDSTIRRVLGAPIAR